MPAMGAAKVFQEASEASPVGSEQQLGLLRQWAAAMQSLGRLEEAEAVFRQGLAKGQATPGAAALANNLAAQLRSQRLGEVEPLLRRAMKGFEGQQDAYTRWECEIPRIGCVEFLSIFVKANKAFGF